MLSSEKLENNEAGAETVGKLDRERQAGVLPHNVHHSNTNPDSCCSLRGNEERHINFSHKHRISMISINVVIKHVQSEDRRD